MPFNPVSQLGKVGGEHGSYLGLSAFAFWHEFGENATPAAAHNIPVSLRRAAEETVAVRKMIFVECSDRRAMAWLVLRACLMRTK